MAEIEVYCEGFVEAHEWAMFAAVRELQLVAACLTIHCQCDVGRAEIDLATDTASCCGHRDLDRGFAVGRIAPTHVEEDWRSKIIELTKR
jgi:hypothetical protein